ncbi:MAG TPA: SDR family oxidoreductase, partial [Victivallales bacterium]|nr:SDR family oxidoreductase [Victivallales bacterium]
IDSGFSACIINISSISAETASISRGEYCISKAGMSMMTKLYAVRLAEFDIPVFEIRPGIIMTDMTSAVKDKYDKLIAEGLLLQKRWGQPEDIAKTALMMARGDIAYSTGQVVYVDGGFSISRL